MHLQASWQVWGASSPKRQALWQGYLACSEPDGKDPSQESCAQGRVQAHKSLSISAASSCLPSRLPCRIACLSAQGTPAAPARA